MSSSPASAVHRARAVVTRHGSDRGWWETAVAVPSPALQPFVSEYVGWREQMAAGLVRRELPGRQAPFIIGFEDPIRLFDPARPNQHADLGGFVTGAYDVCQLVGSTGPTAGVQLNFTLLGMRRLLSRPLAELRNRAVSLDDVFGPGACSWADQLATLSTWEARFDAVDALLTPRLLAGQGAPALVRHVWHRLVASRGRARISDLVSETGVSQKHLIHCVRREIGLSPKTLGRVLRFGHVVESLRGGRGASVADLAAVGDYYDQSHFTRDVHRFAGVTPGALIASLMPDRGGFAAEPDR